MNIFNPITRDCGVVEVYSGRGQMELLMRKIAP
jgi:hypothetical protein